jgi:hypothetical protein
MRKKFNMGSNKPIRKIQLSPELIDAKKKFKKLINQYKNKPLDDEAVRKGYKIFTRK